ARFAEVLSERPDSERLASCLFLSRRLIGEDGIEDAPNSPFDVAGTRRTPLFVGGIDKHAVPLNRHWVFGFGNGRLRNASRWREIGGIGLRLQPCFADDVA